MAEHGYYAFIDETGSEGDPTNSSGCEHLAVAAVVVRYNNLQAVTEIWDRANRLAKKDSRWRWPSFKKLNSDHDKFLIARTIATLPIRFAVVIGHKPMLDNLDHNAEHGSLYFLLSQLLAERISWIIRDAEAVTPSLSPQVKMIFSDRSSLKYDEFRNYVAAVKSGNSKYRSNAEWQHIDIDAICSRKHDSSEALRVADFVASSFGRAIEYKRYDLFDDRLVRIFSKLCYAPTGRKAWRNGLKIFPPEAEASLPSDDERFKWVKTHYGG